MEWSRTLRVDAPPTDAVKAQIADALVREGIRIEFGTADAVARTYALVRGPQSIDPAELESANVSGRWYPEAVIALAIEPTPADALPALARALGGPGAPAGVQSCEVFDNVLAVELRAELTQPGFVLALVDVELRRFGGHRRVRLLSPMPASLLASVAAAGLQGAHIREDRILESLLERTHVE